MDPNAFLGLVRAEIAPLAAEYGLRETSAKDSHALKSVLFSNGRRNVEVYLDVRDGYLDAQYADASLYKPDGGLMEPVRRSFSLLRSVRALLKDDGVHWPDRYGGLFESGRLEQAVRDLVSGMARHHREVFDAW